MKTTDYLSDEELLLLMESVEKDMMLAAPGYLKENILAKTTGTNTGKRHELLFFGTKILVAAAAAIAMLITMPNTEQLSRISQTAQTARRESAAYEIEDSVLWKFNQKANQFCSQLSDSADFIFYKEEN